MAGAQPSHSMTLVLLHLYINAIYIHGDLVSRHSTTKAILCQAALDVAVDADADPENTPV